LWVHHVHKLSSGSLEVLQLLLSLLLLFAQRLDLLKAAGELLLVSAITFYSLSTSSVWRYSIFFTSVSSPSLYV
jgi:hypothetical protein